MTSFTEEIRISQSPQSTDGIKEKAVENVGGILCVCVQVQLVLMSTIHASPTGAIHPPSARCCPREATSASVPWDGRGGTATKVM